MASAVTTLSALMFISLLKSRCACVGVGVYIYGVIYLLYDGQCSDDIIRAHVHQLIEAVQPALIGTVQFLEIHQAALHRVHCGVT